MNHSVRDQAAPIVPEVGLQALPEPSIWPGLAALAGFPLLNFGLATRADGILIPLMASLAGYWLGIFLYRSLADWAYLGRIRLLIGAAIGATILAGLVAPGIHSPVAMTYTATIAAAALVVGRTVQKENRLLRSFFLGALVIVLGGLIMYGPLWSIIMDQLRIVSMDNAESLRQSMLDLGYHEAAANEYRELAIKVSGIMARLVPAASILTLVAPYTLGFLWFLMRGLPAKTGNRKIAPVARWQVPFAFAPVMIVVIMGRLLGGELIVLAADNLLLALAICYGVGGLALIQHSLNRLQLPKGVKIAFYVALVLMGLTPLGLVGFMVAALVGFIDSFADWRKLSAGSIELMKK